MQNIMNSTRMPLAAPYERADTMGYASQPSFQEEAPRYSHGGSARKGKIAVHLNPKEAHLLDHLQGETKHHRGDINVKDYSDLEALIKNRHLVKSVHHHAARHHHANGGSASLDQMAQNGINGDTQMAMIGPETKKLFDQYATDHQTNPYDGHPQYWSLGGALGGLWDTVKGVGQAAIPHLMPMAQQALGDRFGDVGKMAAGVLPTLTRSLGAPSDQNGFASNLGNSLGQAAQSYAGGSSASQALGQGMNAMGQRMGGAMGGGLSATGGALSQGNSLSNALKSGATQGFNQMGGMRQLGNMATNTLSAFRDGGPNAARQTAMNQMGGYGRRALSPQLSQDQQGFPLQGQ